MRTYWWYAMGWSYLVLTYPMIWRVRYLDWRARAAERDRLADRMTSRISRVLFYLTGSRVKITGLENVPEQGAVLFVSNHQGHMDSIIIHGFINKSKGFISIVEVLKIPILRTWMKYMRCVFVDRKDTRQSLTCINQGIEHLKSGQSMVVFPEGHLTDGVPLEDFKRGWLKLATKSGVPIVPVCVKNSYKILSKDGSSVRSAIVECVISKPVFAINLKKEEEAGFIEEVRASIIACL
jgi:1-acyl-sn-glycerol-3-phosphate acyltransferase